MADLSGPDAMIRGTRVVPLMGRRPKIHSGERYCPRCGTPLSRYNPGPFCYGHRPLQPLRVRGWVDTPGAGVDSDRSKEVVQQ